MFKVSGALSLERKILATDEFTIIQDPNDGSPILGLKNHPNIIRALPLIHSKRITVAPMWHLISSVCDRCRAAYESCDCIKLVDDGVSQTVTEAKPLGFFWTDRSAQQLDPSLPTKTEQDPQ